MKEIEHHTRQIKRRQVRVDRTTHKVVKDSVSLSSAPRQRQIREGLTSERNDLTQALQSL